MKSICLYTYIFLLTCCGTKTHGIFSGRRKEVQTFLDSGNDKLIEAADLLEAEYAIIDNLKAKSQGLEGSIQEQTQTLDNLKQQVEKSRIDKYALDQNNKELKGENEKLESLKNMLTIQISNEESKIDQISQRIKESEDLKVMLVDDIKILKEEEATLKSTTLDLEDEKRKLNESFRKLIKENENVQKEKQSLDSTILSLNQEQIQLSNEKATKEKEFNELGEKINLKNAVIIELDFKVTTVKKDIEYLDQKRDELRKGNEKMLKEMCKEHYTFWNLDFLSNNKESVFTSFLINILIGASLQFLIGYFNTKQSSELKSFNPNKDRFKEASPSRLEHMSDDEDNSAMVPSSSMISKKDLTYNYDRDSMEMNEDPSGCFDYIRKKYRIKKNMDHHWETLKHGKSIEFNLWKIESGELILTKLLIMKVIKAKKPLLTFELFQTKLRDGSSYSDCEETELDEEDNRIEAKLAMKIYDRLPDFSV